MKVLTLGCGNFSSIKYHNTSFLLNDSLLFDCGRDIKFSLHDAGLKPKDIKNIFISHQHGDHLAGLDYILTMNYFTPGAPKPNLYFHSSLLSAVTKFIEIFMETFEDAQLPKDDAGRPRKVQLKDICTPHILEDNAVFNVDGMCCSLVQSMHIVQGGMFMPSFGLVVDNIFITGDTQFCPSQLVGFIKNSDATIIDCETTPFKSGVHAHIEDLATLGVAKKLLLSHYGDNVDAEYMARYPMFRGFMRKGEIIEI